MQQAKVYRDGLLKSFEAIAEHPEIGTDQSDIFPKLRRLVHGSHAIYYRIDKKEIVMMRLLGPGQDPLSKRQGGGER